MTLTHLPQVCARMADVDNAVGQMLGARTIQALVDAVRRAANDATDGGDGVWACTHPCEI
jgi:hypothetical protein